MPCAAPVLQDGHHHLAAQSELHLHCSCSWQKHVLLGDKALLDKLVPIHLLRVAQPPPQGSLLLHPHHQNLLHSCLQHLLLHAPHQ